MSTTLDLDLRPVSGALGAEIRGIDLEHVTDAGFEALHAALMEHHVVFLPDQQLSPDGHVALARRFGEIEIHPFIPKLDDDHQEIVVLDSSRGAKADTWHTDVTFSASPPICSVLKMVETPSHGGDTMWINQAAVYDALSAPIRELVDGLSAVHTASAFGHPEVQTEHPAVRELNIVAYAGVPLTMSGHALGTLCVIDVEPRAWSYDEVETLKDLAECAMREIDLRTRLRETEEARRSAEARANRWLRPQVGSPLNTA